MDNQAPPVATDRAPDFPRFGIRHMLLWAVCLAAVMPVAKCQFVRHPDADPVLTTALWIIEVIHQSAAVMVLPVFVLRLWRRLRFPEHPGERYWLIQGIMAVVWMIAMAGPRSGQWYTFIVVLVWPSLLWLALLLHAWWRVGRGPWRWFFGMDAARQLLHVLWVLTRWLAAVSPYDLVFLFEWSVCLPQCDRLRLLAILVGLICVALDWHRGRRYPWTHWWGVGLLLATGVGTLWWSVLS